MLYTLDDLALYWPESVNDPDRADLLKYLVEGLVYSVIPQATADASVVAKAIGLEVTARAYRNAEGYSSETVDDYTYRRDTATGAAGVYLTEDEQARLLGLTTGGRKRVRSLRLRSWSVPQT